jgi:hypothetical protein
LDNYIADSLEALAPHKSVFDLNAPKNVSQNLSIPKTVVGTFSNYVSMEERGVDPVKLARMETLFVN